MDISNDFGWKPIYAAAKEGTWRLSECC